MELRRLSNLELHNSFIVSVQSERRALKDVLLHVIEIDRRQMYFDYDCSSLFGYMTSVMGYSTGPAQRRIDAARLSYEVPELVETIHSGDLNLDQVRLVQQSIRQVAKENNQVVSASQKIELFNQIAGKSVTESEVIVAQTLNVAPKKSVIVQRQADGSVRMELSFTPEQWAKQEEMRTLLSHSLPTGSWDDIYDYLAGTVIQQKSKHVEKRKYNKKVEPVQEAVVVTNCDASPAKNEDAEKLPLSKDDVRSEKQGATAKNVNQNAEDSSLPVERKHISLEVQRQVFKRDKFCQHVNHKTGNKCQSKWQLQTDHIVSIWAGGDNSLENLHLLCANHHQAKYRREAGIKRA